MVIFYPWFMFNISIHLYKSRPTCLVVRFVHRTIIPSWGEGQYSLNLCSACHCIALEGLHLSQHTFFQFLSERGCIGQQQSGSWEGSLAKLGLLLSLVLNDTAVNFYSKSGQFTGLKANRFLFLFFKFILFIYLASSGSSCGTWDLCHITQDLLLQHTGSPVEEHGLSSCGMGAQLPHGMWDHRSPTRDQTHIPCIARWIPNTGPPGNSLLFN